jgi:hypothetical protein
MAGFKLASNKDINIVFDPLASAIIETDIDAKPKDWPSLVPQQFALIAERRRKQVDAQRRRPELK